MGAIILVSAVVAEPQLEISRLPDIGVSTAELAFEEISIEGQTRITANNGSFLIDGPTWATITAPLVDARLHNYTYVSGNVDGPPLFLKPSAGPNETHDETYEDVRITIQGTTKGLVQGWSASSGSFQLDLNSDPSTIIHASQTSTPLKSASGGYYHEAAEPTYGISHHGAQVDHHEIPFMTLGKADFHSMSAQGSLVVLIEEADVTVEHGDQQEEIRLRTEDWIKTDFPHGRVGAMRHLALSIPFGSLATSFDGTKAVFLTPDADLNVTGEMVFHQAGGRVAMGEVPEDINGERIEAIGNTTMLLSVEGDPDAIRQIGPLEWGSESPPKSKASVQSLDGQMTVDGRPLATIPLVGPPSLNDEATFLARLVGILLMAWAAIRWGTVFVAGMVARKPLANARRRSLFDLLRAQGLAHVRDLHRITGIPLGTLVYHLDVLRQAKLVRSIQTAGYRIYFVPSVSFCHDEMRRLVLLAEPTRRGICKALYGNEGMTHTDLAERLSLSHSQVAKQLKLLVGQRLVERKGSRNARFVLTDLTKRWLAADPAPVPDKTPICSSDESPESGPVHGHGT